MNQIFYLIHYTLNGLRKDTANNSDICFNDARNQILKRKSKCKGDSSIPFTISALHFLSLYSIAGFRLIKSRTLILASACKWGFYLDVCPIAYIGVHIDGKWYLEGAIWIAISYVPHLSSITMWAKNVQVDADLCFLSKG